MNDAMINLLVDVQRCADCLAKDSRNARRTLLMMVEDQYEGGVLPPWYMQFLSLAEALIDQWEAA